MLAELIVAAPENVPRPPAARVRGDADALTCCVDFAPSAEVTSIRFDTEVISTEAPDWLVRFPLTDTRHWLSPLGSAVTVTSQATPPLGHGPDAEVVVVGAVVVVVVVGALVVLVVVAPRRVVVVRPPSEVLVVGEPAVVVDEVLASDPVACVDEVGTLSGVVSPLSSTVVDGRDAGVEVVVEDVPATARTSSDPPSPPPGQRTRASAAATRSTRARPNAIMTR